MTIEVLIPTWNGRELLSSCLTHLQRQTQAHQVTVIDNGSTDGSVEMLHQQFPDVKVIELQENIGFGAAINRGISASSAEILVLLNNDVDAYPDCLERLVAPLTDPAVGMVAGMTLIPNTNQIDAFGIEITPTLTSYNFKRYAAADSTIDSSVITGPSGGLAAYRREALNQCDGFDEAIFAYLEDVDLCLRIRQQGWQTAAAADARGVHLGSATAGFNSSWQQEMFGFARGYLLRRYRVLRSRKLLRVGFFELLVIGSNLLKQRNLKSITSRVRGWKAAAGKPAIPFPVEATNQSIGWLEELKRLVKGP